VVELRCHESSKLKLLPHLLRRRASRLKGRESRDVRLCATPEQLCDALGACTELNAVYRRLLDDSSAHRTVWDRDTFVNTKLDGFNEMARPARLELATLCLEATQYKTLSAASGVAYEEVRHLSRP
jgi:hypothetical protein